MGFTEAAWLLKHNQLGLVKHLKHLQEMFKGDTQTRMPGVIKR